MSPQGVGNITSCARILSMYTPLPGVSSPRFAHIRRSDGVNLGAISGTSRFFARKMAPVVAREPKKFLEPAVGIEPTTAGLQGRCATVAPCWQGFSSISASGQEASRASPFVRGAGDFRGSCGGVGAPRILGRTRGLARPHQRQGRRQRPC